ncbi:hypothetical protein ACLMJK_008594 [Lecanora helva]
MPDDVNMKRKPDDISSLDNVKLIKTEKDSTTDYSKDVKKKISASARTGQACDRCRVRKMRCDDQPNGCAPCMQNQSECKTTDRITGKATVRGYVQSLERQLDELHQRQHRLESRLAALGEDVGAIDYTDPSTAPLVQWHEEQASSSRQTWDNTGQACQNPHQKGVPTDVKTTHRSHESAPEEHPAKLPDFRSGLAGNNYLGVSTGNNLLSSITGTSMTVLGMDIDLADYMSADVDEPDPSLNGAQPVYNKSYRAFVQTAFGISPKLTQVELPPKIEAMNYAHVYFRIVNPYLPLVHEPSMLATLARIYDDPTFKPPVAEIVKVHTMLAIMYSQYAIRAPQTSEQAANLVHSSNFHYHYALGFFGQLMASHTLADVQAMAMLCLHVRNSPKPTACWMITSIALDLAIELGLHRSAKRWAPSAKRSPLEIEIRKRVFWSILTVHVDIAGNLGRPMPMGSDDWDVEMPEAIDDHLISEKGIDTTTQGKCNFLLGVQSFHLIPIKMDLYNNIYAVKRSPQTYVETVLRLEKRLRDWQEQCPPELKHESSSDNEVTRVHHHYLAIWAINVRLLLRHPSLSLATSSEFNSENLTICMDISRKMLEHVKQLQRYKSLDGTWQTGALYVLALATTLFGHWERKDQIDARDLSALRDDMYSWLDVIGDMSDMFGSGKRLQDAVRVPVDRTMGLLTQHLSAKAGRSATASNKQSQPQPHSLPLRRQPTASTYGQANGYNNYGAHVNHPANDEPPGNSYLPPNTDVPTRASEAYPDPQYNYQTPYPSGNATYVSPSYASNDTLPATAAAANAFLHSYPPQPQPAPMNPNYPPNLPNNNYNQYHSPGSPTSWRTWAGNMASNLEPGAEYMSSASALMQLGGRSEGPVSQEFAVDSSTGQAWPLMLFDGAPTGGH